MTIYTNNFVIYLSSQFEDWGLEIARIAIRSYNYCSILPRNINARLYFATFPLLAYQMEGKVSGLWKQVALNIFLAGCSILLFRSFAPATQGSLQNVFNSLQSRFGAVNIGPLSVNTPVVMNSAKFVQSPHEHFRAFSVDSPQKSDSLTFEHLESSRILQKKKLVAKPFQNSFISPSNGTDILSHPIALIRCKNQTQCVQPRLQLEKSFDVYYCKHVGHGVRFYFLVREGDCVRKYCIYRN